MTDNTNPKTPDAAEAPASYSRQLGVEIGNEDDVATPEVGTFAELRLNHQDSVEDDTPEDGLPADPVEIGAEGTNHLEDKEGDDVPETDDTEDDKQEEPDTGEAPVFNVAKYQQEWDSSGKKLSEESYAEITKATGLQRADIDAIAKAMQAQQDQNVARWEGFLGGPEGKAAAVAWAKENYTPAQRAAFNRALDSNDPNLVDLAVKGLAADYAAATKTSASAVNSSLVPNYSGNAESAVTPFASESEHRDAVRSEKYKKDPAYRDLVKRRLKASPFFRNSRGPAR